MVAPTSNAPDPELERVRRERDLYLRLLELGTQHDLTSFLRDALAVLVEATRAHQAYLEIHDEHEGASPTRWSMAHGFTDAELETIRSVISTGIIAEALATGQTIVTPSALLDPRFRERGSVKIAHIQEVLCAPIGVDQPRGVLYLQGRASAGSFSAEDSANAEIFARHLAPLADWLLVRERHDPDPTRLFRETLRLDNVVGRSAALASMLRQVALVVPLEVNVLLTGESGTGKSQIARVIHDNGPRSGHPFVELNCAAIPEALVESELFGALPGAHSSALRRIEGKVAAAEHGTLFLDEIGDLALGAQAKVLHLLHAKQYYPLGSAKSVRADVRVIAATNIDLASAVTERRFREDLLYRLQVLPVRIPTLAERHDDIVDLTTYFCAAACERHGLSHLTLSRGAQRAAESAEWPGNIRQLAHAVEAAAIRAAGESALQIEPQHLFPEASDHRPGDDVLTFQEATRRFQARLLRQALEDAGWNVTEVARRLDLARSHVYKLIRAFGLERGQ
ncbi:MAG: sigma-54-dependent Fis family transcriptional regulator [Deltaproteobacteria bacterium]|nr:sigma-54-dependent Fis family transcriptional regulator [Deltaproteobacteria bacterium]